MNSIANRNRRVGKLPNGAAGTQQSGFTLIELLVVIALTAILMTVIFRPLVDSYNLTSRAGTQIQSQQAAREALRQISAILGSAEYVYDPARPSTSLNIWLTNSLGAPILVTSRFSMIEYVVPAKQLDQNPYLPDPNNPGSTILVPIDPTTGEPIFSPTLPSGQTGIALPLAASRSLGRVWIGLMHNRSVQDTHAPNTAANPFDKLQNGMPAQVYANYFEDSRVPIAQDNRYTLYSAEVPVYIQDPSMQGMQNAPYVPNLGLFHTTDVNGVVTDNVKDAIQLHDPNFFYDNSLAGGTGDPMWAMPGWVDVNKDGKVEIWENWLAVSTTSLLGNVGKVDLIALDRDANTNAILYYDNNGVLTAGTGRPNVRPLVKFAPAFVQNDPGVPTALDSAGNEAPTPVSPMFTSQYTHWSNPYRVLVYRNLNSSADPLSLSPLNYYVTTGDGRVVYVPNIAPNSTPPTDAALAMGTDVGPNFDLMGKGTFRNPAQTQFAFTVDAERGLVNFAFPSSVMVHDANLNPLTSVYDPKLINDRLDPNSPIGMWESRYVDLRTLDPAPINPASASSPLAQTTNWYNNVSITPGSELVFGPDQRPGPHYGFHIQYTRVSANAGTVGTNQYKINYEDVPNAAPAGPQDPHVRVGYIEFKNFAEAGSQVNIPDDGAFPGATYKPHGLPEHKADPMTGLLTSVPSDPVEVSYKFQMNRPNDVVKIDYLTRELMNVTIEARLYDPASGRPQSVTLTDKIKVRNLQH
jgi:prepilin-type N-terminal cleavage/methylation domain-containing protein